MASAALIEVEGLQQTLRAFGRIEKGMRKELRKQLVEIAGVVAETARSIAEQKGLHESGALIARIHPGMRSSYAYVADTARRKSRKYPGGFNYPAVYEYGHGRARAFLEPAAKQDEEKAVTLVEGMLDRLTSQAGFGTGGLL